MKQLSSQSNIILLLITVLSVVSGFDVDNLQYRQIIRRGTGFSSISSTQTSIPPTPTDSSSGSPSSTVISSKISLSSSTPSVSTSATSNAVSNSVTATLSSPSPGSAATSNPSTTSNASLTPASTTNITPSTAKPDSSATTAKPVSSRTQELIITELSTGEATTYTSVTTTSALQAVPRPDGSTDGSNNPGLEQAQKRLIIGVVVGVAGAIILGGLAVVAWRIWGKRKEPADDDHELMDSLPGSSSAEKRSSLIGNSPFRSTLDQYHKPAGPVNTASNF